MGFQVPPGFQTIRMDPGNNPVWQEVMGPIGFCTLLPNRHEHDPVWVVPYWLYALVRHGMFICGEGEADAVRAAGQTVARHGVEHLRAVWSLGGSHALAALREPLLVTP